MSIRTKTKVLDKQVIELIDRIFSSNPASPPIRIKPLSKGLFAFLPINEHVLVKMERLNKIIRNIETMN